MVHGHTEHHSLEQSAANNCSLHSPHISERELFPKTNLRSLLMHIFAVCGSIEVSVR